MDFNQLQQSLLPIFGELPGLKATRLGGLSNLIYKLQHPSLPGILIYKQFLNAPPIQLLTHMSTLAISPKILYISEKFLLEEYVEGQHIPRYKVRDSPALIKSLFAKMSQMHSIPYSKSVPLADSVFNIQSWKTALQYLPQRQRTFNLESTVETITYLQNVFHLSDAASLARFIRLAKPILDSLPYYSDQLLRKGEGVEKGQEKGQEKESRSGLPQGFCHNDLNLLNIIYPPSASFHTPTLIDFEYSSYNYLSYDIANFINELAIDYEVSQFPGYKIMERYSMQTLADLSEYYPTKWEGKCTEVAKFMCIVNLYWAIWSINKWENQEKGRENKQIFSAIEHGITRLQLFWYYYEIVSK